MILPADKPRQKGQRRPGFIRIEECIPVAIEAQGLVKEYGKRRVVDRVSLEVHPGEVVGLLSPNGAGKTTSFYMIVGLEKPLAGQIKIDGTDVTPLPMHMRARYGVSY